MSLWLWLMPWPLSPALFCLAAVLAWLSTCSPFKSQPDGSFSREFSCVNWHWSHRAPESPRGLPKTQIFGGPPPLQLQIQSSGVGSEKGHIYQVPRYGWYCSLWGYSLGTTGCSLPLPSPLLPAFLCSFFPFSFLSFFSRCCSRALPLSYSHLKPLVFKLGLLEENQGP